MSHTWNKRSIEIAFVETQMLHLADENFEVAIIIIFWELKESMPREVEDSMKISSRGYQKR